MARFLFAVLPLAGHLAPNLAVAQALRQQGHQVLLYSGASVADAAAARDLDFAPFIALDEEAIHGTIREIAIARAPWQLRRLWRQILIESIEAQLSDLAPLLDTWQPDVIVCDPLLWGPIVVLHEREPIPVAILSYVAACVLPGDDAPLLGLSLPAAQGGAMRLARRSVRWLIDQVATGVRREVNAIRQRFALPPIPDSVTAYTGRLPLYLMPGSRDFDYARQDLPASVHYVGLLEWQSGPPPAPPAWLQAYQKERPLVYVTEGSVHSRQPHLLQAAVNGLGELPIDLILTTGRHRHVGELSLGPIPANVRVESWVPHRALFPHVDVVVTTGGSGTVLGALAENIPLVVSPTDWDQPENAWRVAAAGAGIRIAASRCTGSRLRAAVEALLTDASYRRAAQHLGESLRKADGAFEAAHLLAQLANGGQAAPSGAMVEDAYQETLS
ncbi:MAG: glycosyltransferase [Ardenticatenales bacterium]|nr:glycosyltransferase [Ardenticatenales bacterium]